MIPYPILRALRNMKQSPFLCVATVGTVAATLTILALFVLILINLQALTGRWSQDVQVRAYLDNPLKGSETKEKADALKKLEGVEDVVFVSREKAYSRMRQRLESADLLDGLSPEVLPVSFEIALEDERRSRRSIEALVPQIQSLLPEADIRYGQQWLERFESFVRMFSAGALVLGSFLLFATLFIVSNTIRLTLYARKDELDIMALVGATPFFIKAPFLLEGALQGALGAILSLAGVFALFHGVFREGLGSLLFSVGSYEIHYLPGNYQLAILGSGVLLGLFGSLSSLRKFVRIGP